MDVNKTTRITGEEVKGKDVEVEQQIHGWVSLKEPIPKNTKRTELGPGQEWGKESRIERVALAWVRGKQTGRQKAKTEIKHSPD